LSWRTQKAHQSGAAKTCGAAPLNMKTSISKRRQLSVSGIRITNKAHGGWREASYHHRGVLGASAAKAREAISSEASSQS